MSAPETATKFAPSDRASVAGGQLVGQSRQGSVAPKAAVKLRLDLNLEVEIAIQAKVNGDITLSLLCPALEFLPVRMVYEEAQRKHTILGYLKDCGCVRSWTPADLNLMGSDDEYVMLLTDRQTPRRLCRESTTYERTKTNLRRTMLPVELCNLIIDHLHDSKPSLLTCSLVCRAWIPECRFHLFHNLRLCRDTADTFFQLFESPHATLASAHIRELDVAQNAVIRGGSLQGDLLEGLAFQGVLTRCPADVFEHVQKLSVLWVGWWTLTGTERLSIGHIFKNVTELALWTVVFQTDEELQALVASFPALEALSLQTIQFRINALEEDHSHAEHTLPVNLHTISFNDVSNPRVIHSLIPCPSLRVFQCHYVNFADFKPALAEEFGQLLSSAGERLEYFGFTIRAAACLNDGVDLDARFKLVNLARTSNLRRIQLWIEDDQYLLPFLIRLTESDFSTPTLETLDIFYLSVHSLDWKKLDDVLQHPYFHVVREIKTSVPTYFSLDDVVGQEPGWYSKPNVGSKAHIEMGNNIANFMDLLPRCRARGILRPAEEYQFFDSWFGSPARQRRRERLLDRMAGAVRGLVGT
ncbi:hypothetical protein EV421DRAFT_1739363 [Armillaria borealis]|uniref:F-box/LRR-repeat protein 15/At3g58940/PEG3-like LRR domain-containing protein n=1 Tax=Armillaria borealis TaxID=47425 RepID=A0AA39J7P3_9AGAR|nr:hypothetical protein EV421DRAFT_1739363 [Armillaria borealis]